MVQSGAQMTAAMRAAANTRMLLQVAGSTRAGQTPGQV